MDSPYEKIMQPYRLTEKITLKNRISFPCGQHALTQGPETWASEAQIAEAATLCSSGASLISLNNFGKHAGGPPAKHIPEEFMSDKGHYAQYNFDDPSSHNYLSQLAAMCHMNGSKLLVKLGPKWPMGKSYGGGDARSLMPLPEGVWYARPYVSKHYGTDHSYSHEDMLARICPKEQLKAVIDDLVAMCKLYKLWGWDGMNFRCDRFLDADTNLRTDEYNGEIEDRGRFCFELFTAIRKELGRDFIIEAVLCGRQDHGGDGELRHGYTLDEAIRFTKMVEDLVDIVQIREETSAGYHCGTYNSQAFKHNSLNYAHAFRAAGVKATIAVNSGYHDPKDIEAALESGDCDLVCTARAFIAEPQYMKKLYSHGAEKATPCIRCNKCHGLNAPPWLAYCSVNPKSCITHRLAGVITPPLSSKKVAVIGGGPVGMRTACFAAERGHKVTLYEKTGYLGGKLKHADLYSFKWPIKNYRLWLIEELERRGVEVKLHHEPTPDELRAIKYDAIIACTGSREVRPQIEGAAADGIWLSEDVYESRAALGQKIVMVGGGEVATETAMYLAEQGKDVTLITRSDMLMKKEYRPHGPHEQFEHIIPELGYGGTAAAWDVYDNFKAIYEAVTTKVTSDSVTYVKDGAEQMIECDSVIVNGGYKGCIEEAVRYAGSADEFYLAGDVEEDICSNLQQGNFSAFGKANLL